MSRPGGFNTYWKARDRLILEGAEPADSVSATAIPFDRPVQVTVTECCVGQATGPNEAWWVTVRDGSGRTHRWLAPGPFGHMTGTEGTFVRRFAPDSPRLLRLKAESGFALVSPSGGILEFANRADTLRPKVTELCEFRPKGTRNGKRSS